MAYNPFNIFRRNQKALFAVLTVFIMIIFTLSSGIQGGDFFDVASRWLGGSRGDSICKIDGRTITSRDLEGPRGKQFQRVMANRFMALAANQITISLKNYLIEQQSKLGPEGKETASQALEVLSMMERPQFAAFVVPELPTLEFSLNQRIESPTARPEDKEVARAVQVMYRLLYKVTMGGGSHYFLNAPNKTRRDLIEFMLWEKKADQLGIKFTRDDVTKLIQTEFYGFHKSDVEIRKAMKDTPGFTIEACMDAIAVEFKVRAAQTAVLGQMSRFHRAPAYPTPYEAFEYYRDQCSPAVYELIPVPAAGFVKQVKGEPSDAQIKELFDKYQNDEPNPKSETPGFKDPRKISVAYLGITGEEPYYKKLAEEQVKIGEKMAQASGLLTVPLPGALNTWAAGAVAPMMLKEPAIDAAYNTHTMQFKFQMRNEYSSSSLYARDILPSSVVKPGVLAATVGGFVGQTAGFGNPVAAVSVSMGAPIGYEIRDRVKVGIPLALGFTPGPAMIPNLVGATAISSHHEPKPLPADFLRPELLKSTIDARAKVIAFGSQQEKGDVKQFIEELGKLAPDGKPKDKAAVEKYIEDFIKARGLTVRGHSTAPRDEFTLEDDPGLLPLVLAQKESLRQAKGFHGGAYVPFGQSFFWTTVPIDFMRTRRGPATSGLYQASPYPPNDFSARDDGRAHYVVWRTEDLPAKKTNLVTARAAVVEAWKRLEARKLALAHANRVAEQIRAHPVTDPIPLSQFLADRAFDLQVGFDDPKARQRAKPFTINGVCPLVPSTNPMAMMQGGGGQLERFALKETDSLPYPTPEMQKELLDNRDKPAKTVLVLPDAPKDTFYVATLMRRDLRTPDDFRFNVYSRFGSAQMIRGLYTEEAMKKTRDSVVDLLKKEFKYEETEEQKKKLDENAKSGNQD